MVQRPRHTPLQPQCPRCRHSQQLHGGALAVQKTPTAARTPPRPSQRTPRRVPGTPLQQGAEMCTQAKLAARHMRRPTSPAPGWRSGRSRVESEAGSPGTSCPLRLARDAHGSGAVGDMQDANRHAGISWRVWPLAVLCPGHSLNRVPAGASRDEANLATNEAAKSATMKIDEPETPWASPPRELLEDDGTHLLPLLQPGGEPGGPRSRLADHATASRRCHARRGDTRGPISRRSSTVWVCCRRQCPRRRHHWCR